MFRILLAAAAVLTGNHARAGELRFEDVTASLGLGRYLADYQLCHASAWGDVNGDGRPDLYVGAFADRPVYRTEDAPIPNMLFLGGTNGFALSGETAVRLKGDFARSTMAFFADLDNDGDLDLFVGNHVNPDERNATGKPGSLLFENAGDGRFRNVTPSGPAWPSRLPVRNVTSFDIDQDGRLDLIMVDGAYANARNDKARLHVLRNKGGWQFDDITRALGFPDEGTVGLGLAVGDVNEDGRFDLFVAQCNRLFLSAPNGIYHESQAGDFVRPDVGPRADHERLACGAAFGDLNGDGRQDLVVTVHGQPARLYIYMNETTNAVMPHFVDRTTAMGLDALFPRTGITTQPVKTAHVELLDMDNDGRVDIYVANTWKTEDGRIQPMVLRNLGNDGALPRFTRPALDQLVGYYAPGPAADFDRDGRMDVFLPGWFTAPEVRSMLFRNVTDSGHWLEVKVRGDRKTRNATGVGAIVRAYRAGHAGDATKLIARADIVVSTGYSSGVEALAHLGMGDAASCDVIVQWGGATNAQRDVPCDRLMMVDFGS